MFVEDESGRFFDLAKAILIEADKNYTGRIRRYRVEYPAGQSIRVKLKHEELMRALAVVVPAAPGTKAERAAVLREDLEGQCSWCSEGVFPVIAWLIRPDMPDEPEPVLLLDNKTRRMKIEEKENFEEFHFEFVPEQ